jgi:hypothetical protein
LYLSDFDWKSPKEGVIFATRLAGGVRLVIQAENARKQATGLHAKLTVALAEVGAKAAKPIVSDTFNIDKESQRHDFVNVLYGHSRRAGKFTAEFIELYRREDFERDLYDFCEEFYGELVGRGLGGFVSGDAEKSLPGSWIDGLLLKEGGTILFALPGSGKSYTGMLMAQSVNAGVGSIFRVEQTVPLYINLERGEKSMSRRLGLVNRVLGLPTEHPLLMLNKRGRTLADVYDIAKEMIEEHRVQTVFLDSLSRAGVGDMNANEKSNDSMDLLNALSPSWLAIGHTPRGDATHVYGSIMFDAAMDLGISAIPELKDDGTLGVGLNVTKTNDTGRPPLRILAYEFDTYGLLKVRESDKREFPKIVEAIEESKGGVSRTNGELIYDNLLAFGKRTQADLVKDLRLNAGTVSKEINDLISQGRVANLGKEGRSFVYGVPSKDVNYEGHDDGHHEGKGTPPLRGVPGVMESMEEPW